MSSVAVYKEHEMEIGYPTDVRHVAHIGWGSASGNAASWVSFSLLDNLENLVLLIWVK